MLLQTIKLPQESRLLESFFFLIFQGNQLTPTIPNTGLVHQLLMLPQRMLMLAFATLVVEFSIVTIWLFVPLIIGQMLQKIALLQQVVIQTLKITHQISSVETNLLLCSVLLRTVILLLDLMIQLEMSLIALNLTLAVVLGFLMDHMLM